MSRQLRARPLFVAQIFLQQTPAPGRSNVAFTWDEIGNVRCNYVIPVPTATYLENNILDPNCLDFLKGIFKVARWYFCYINGHFWETVTAAISSRGKFKKKFFQEKLQELPSF